MANLGQIFEESLENLEKVNGCNHLQQEFQHPGPLKLQFLKETNDDYSIFREMWASFRDFQPGLALRWEGHPGAIGDPEAALSGQSGGFDENLMGFLDFEPDDSSGQSNQVKPIDC